MALDYEKLSKEFTKKLQKFDKEKIDAWMKMDNKRIKEGRFDYFPKDFLVKDYSIPFYHKHI